jgi:hypothetical protein
MGEMNLVSEERQIHPVLFLTGTPKFNDPSNQCSALSALKQHWLTVTCLPDALPVALFLNHLTILSAASLLEYTRTATDLQLCAFMFRVQMKS